MSDMSHTHTHTHTHTHYAAVYIFRVHCIHADQPRGLVVRASGYKSRGPGFDSRLYHGDFSMWGEDPRGDHGLGS